VEYANMKYEYDNDDPIINMNVKK